MKILALHGYTQSGPSFQRKVRRLQYRLEESFPDVEFCFPTGPIRLRPSEKAQAFGLRQHGADANAKAFGSTDRPDPDDIDAYAWHTLHAVQDPPPGYQQSLDILADVLRREGPFDGVLAFSQGTILAVMIASILEGSPRREAFVRFQQEWPEAFPYPESYKNLHHPPLKFGITYGALMGVGKKYSWLYDKPLIHTPFLHFRGLYDPVVSVKMAQTVENARIGGDKAIRIVHPGAHNVCVGAKYLDAVTDFIQGLEYYAEPPTPEPQQISQELHTINQPLDFMDWKFNRTLPKPCRGSLKKPVSGDSIPGVSQPISSHPKQKRMRRRLPLSRVASSKRSPSDTTGTASRDLAPKPLGEIWIKMKILPIASRHQCTIHF
ncbi:MAG: hypothetical protein LQ349_004045 [Xanthoria aureola]|nr:MAG: hypothetical protein LQ349_004045 [Xanthoria aureola]